MEVKNKDGDFVKTETSKIGQPGYNVYWMQQPSFEVEKHGSVDLVIEGSGNNTNTYLRDRVIIQIRILHTRTQYTLLSLLTSLAIPSIMSF